MCSCKEGIKGKRPADYDCPAGLLYFNAFTSNLHLFFSLFLLFQFFHKPKINNKNTGQILLNL